MLFGVQMLRDKIEFRVCVTFGLQETQPIRTTDVRYC